MSVRRLWIALGVGVGIEFVLLLFGLHASLWLAQITGGHTQAYWVLNGLYLVLGIALGLLVVRWASLSLRIAAAAAVLLIGTGIGFVAVLR